MAAIDFINGEGGGGIKNGKKLQNWKMGKKLPEISKKKKI